MKFWKMNGAGNDFVILNAVMEELPEARYPEFARVLCERHLSIGADGLMVVDRSEKGADFRMRFYNSDGSLGEMCGNGARCICRYGYEMGLCGETQTIETTAGIVTGERLSARRYRIRLNDPSVIDLDRTVEVNGETVHCAYVELGNPGLPHVVIEHRGLGHADISELRALGRALRWHEAFPKGANVNFYELTGKDTILERTYERGVEDFTYACGTGTGSTVAVLTLQGLVSGENVRALMPGGRLTVDVKGNGGKGIYLTGPTNIVCKGEVTDEELEM